MKNIITYPLFCLAILTNYASAQDNTVDSILNVAAKSKKLVLFNFLDRTGENMMLRNDREISFQQRAKMLIFKEKVDKGEIWSFPPMKEILSKYYITCNVSIPSPECERLCSDNNIEMSGLPECVVYSYTGVAYGRLLDWKPNNYFTDSVIQKLKNYAVLDSNLAILNARLNKAKFRDIPFLINAKLQYFDNTWKQKVYLDFFNSLTEKKRFDTLYLDVLLNHPFENLSIVDSFYFDKLERLQSFISLFEFQKYLLAAYDKAIRVIFTKHEQRIKQLPLALKVCKLVKEMGVFPFPNLTSGIKISNYMLDSTDMAEHEFNSCFTEITHFPKYYAALSFDSLSQKCKHIVECNDSLANFLTYQFFQAAGLFADISIWNLFTTYDRFMLTPLNAEQVSELLNYSTLIRNRMKWEFQEKIKSF